MTTVLMVRAEAPRLHLFAMSGNRTRVLADWILNATTPAEATSLAAISAESVPLDVNTPRA